MSGGHPAVLDLDRARGALRWRCAIGAGIGLVAVLRPGGAGPAGLDGLQGTQVEVIRAI